MLLCRRRCSLGVVLLLVRSFRDSSLFSGIIGTGVKRLNLGSRNLWLRMPTKLRKKDCSAIRSALVNAAALQRPLPGVAKARAALGLTRDTSANNESTYMRTSLCSTAV